MSKKLTLRQKKTLSFHNSNSSFKSTVKNIQNVSTSTSRNMISSQFKCFLIFNVLFCDLIIVVIKMSISIYLNKITYFSHL